MESKGEQMTTNTDQTELRGKDGRFQKGHKPRNGFDKNPQNIAPGGFWRYKEHGKVAILNIFKMSVSEFQSIEEIEDTEKTVLDKVLFVKFKSAMDGSSKDADFLLNQAFGYAPRYIEAKHDYQADFNYHKCPLDELTVDELREALKKI